jgi:hypothetical protein
MNSPYQGIECKSWPKPTREAKSIKLGPSSYQKSKYEARPKPIAEAKAQSSAQAVSQVKMQSSAQSLKHIEYSTCQ